MVYVRLQLFERQHFPMQLCQCVNHFAVTRAAPSSATVTLSCRAIRDPVCSGRSRKVMHALSTACFQLLTPSSGLGHCN
jgi:hypothetical protein